MRTTPIYLNLRSNYYEISKSSVTTIYHPLYSSQWRFKRYIYIPNSISQRRKERIFHVEILIHPLPTWKHNIWYWWWIKMNFLDLLFPWTFWICFPMFPDQLWPGEGPDGGIGDPLASKLRESPIFFDASMPVFPSPAFWLLGIACLWSPIYKAFSSFVANPCST